MKGKNGAQAARRNDLAHEAEINALRAGHATQMQEAEARRRDLQAQMDRLAGDLERRVRDVSEARIREAEERCEARVQKEQRDFRAKVAALGNLMEDWVLPAHGVERILEVLGVTFGELFTERKEDNRLVRRTGSARIKRLAAVDENATARGMKM